jgi:acetyltransferase
MADTQVPEPDTWTLRNGDVVTIRPIRPDDVEPMVVFHQGLSENSVYQRFAEQLTYAQRVAHERLVQRCTVDPEREIALVAERLHTATGQAEIVAIIRLAHIEATDDGEFGLLVRDDCQGQGLGAELLRRVLVLARRQGLKRVVAWILWHNRPMQAVCRRLGFTFTHEEAEDPMIEAVRVL